MRLIGKQGELFEADLDRAGIRQSEFTSKDALVVSQRRSVILTNIHLIGREIAKKEEKVAHQAQVAEQKAKRKATTEANKAKKALKAEQKNGPSTKVKK